MKVNYNVNVSSLNTFAIEARCPAIYHVTSLDDLAHLPELTLGEFYILGEGSNTLFVDEKTPLLIRPLLKGISIEEQEEAYILNVGAGENWHKLVQRCVDDGIYGLENLALIPGSVGAAPVQNIGAYGVELSEFVESVTWYSFKERCVIELTNNQCEFGYRDSIFKHALKQQGLILAVRLKCQKHWQPKLSYAGLDQLNKNVSAREVLDRVIQIRNAKLPDPKSIPNAGSFFKNPIVSQSLFKKLIEAYPTVPHYLTTDGQIKVAAGWLIDQCGLKGFSLKGAGIHQLQALVIVNLANASGKEVIALADYICKQVQLKFAIDLVPEVRLVTEQGEVEFNELLAHV